MTEFEKQVIDLLKSIESKLSSIESDVNFLESKVIDRSDLENLLGKILPGR